MARPPMPEKTNETQAESLQRAKSELGELFTHDPITNHIAELYNILHYATPRTEGLVWRLFYTVQHTERRRANRKSKKIAKDEQDSFNRLREEVDKPSFRRTKRGNPSAIYRAFKAHEKFRNSLGFGEQADLFYDDPPSA